MEQLKMAQALYRKWRPQTFEEVVGQEHVTQTLRNALIAGRVGHAYLFAGLRGTGKTTMARLMAKAVNCLAEDVAARPCNECSICLAVNDGRFLDLIEIDAASHTSVDDVRELREKVGFRPNEGRYKVYIIDEVHRFSGSAFDALLKTIEEPPDHAIFILATTEIHKVPATILSRCQRFDFRRIPVKQITHRLARLAEEEGISAQSEALALIALTATGSLRDAESMLDQLASANPTGITLAQVQSTLGTIDTQLVARLVDNLVQTDVAAGLATIDEALDQGADLRQFVRQVVDYLRSMLLIKLDGSDLLNTGLEDLGRLERQTEQIETTDLIRAIKRFSQSEGELRGGWHPQLPLELALIEAMGMSPADASGTGDVGTQPAGPRPKPSAASENSDSIPAPTLHEAMVVPKPPAEPEASVASAANTAPLSSEGLDLGQVLGLWRAVLDNMRDRDRSVQALLNSTRPGKVQDDVVTLYVAHEFARSKLSQSRSKRLVEQVLSEELGQACRIDLLVVDDSEESETQLTQNEQQDQNTWANDPLVQEAKKMGAEVRQINEGREYE
jgi:DNA polymerase-3 subunit gamma/tau